jgi:uncharacterized repeat protein (TIGR03917 family)
MDTNPPWTRGGAAPPDVVTFLCSADGATVSVGAQPATEAGTADPPLVVLRVCSSGTAPAVLRLLPEEARRLAALLTSAADGPPARSTHPAGARLGAAGSPPVPHTQYALTVPEGCPVAELRQLLAPLPPGARLVDFSSDTDVLLVFATGDPRWSSRPQPQPQPQR